MDAELGRYAAAERIGINPTTLRAFVSGAPCRKGTVLQIQAAVEKYVAAKPSA